MSRLPLEGIRVVDSTYIFAMPYAAAMMADLGAEVIKIEGPGHSDPLRIGLTGAFADNVPGHDPWNRTGAFNQLNRGKNSLTLDLSKEEGREVLKGLLKVSDVFLENYTPRVTRGWGLDYPNVKKLKPDIIMVSNTGYGHGEGCWSSYPAQATTQEATHGLCYITGHVNGAPSKAGNAYVDFWATWSCLFGVASALRHRHKTGNGQWIDIGMYQLGCFAVSEYIMDWTMNGRLGGRIGNRHPYRAPQGCYPCAGEDQWCVISIGDDEEWRALCTLMGKPELVRVPQFATLQERRKNHDALDAIISSWTRESDKFALMDKLQADGVPAGPVFDSKDCNLNPHYWEHGFLEKVEFPPEREVGVRAHMGRPWRLSKTRIAIKTPAPKLGEHNDEILANLLALDGDDIGDLEDDGIIGDRPLNLRPVTKRNFERDVQSGIFAYWDPDYKARLGI